MHAKGDPPMSDRGPSCQRSPRRCDSTTATVLLTDGVVRPSRASEHMDALWSKRTIKTILEASFRQTGRQDGSALVYAYEG